MKGIRLQPVDGVVFGGTAAVTVSNGVVPAFKTYLFALWKTAFHTVKGHLLHKCRKQAETVSKSRPNATN